MPEVNVVEREIGYESETHLDRDNGVNRARERAAKFSGYLLLDHLHSSNRRNDIAGRCKPLLSISKRRRGWHMRRQRR